MRKEGLSTGDCVDCNACVAVCPMGIDIRDGQQLECITCALCIDACDGVMSKLGLEKGLIEYTTLNAYDANMALAGAGSNVLEPKINPENIRDAESKLTNKVSQFSWRNFIRPRTLIYAAIYAAIGLAMIFSLVNRDRLDVKVLHDRNPLFVVLSDGSVRNGFELKILNMKGEARQFLITVGGLKNPQLVEAGGYENRHDWVVVEVKADKLKSVRLFVTVPKEDLIQSSTEFTFNVSHMGGTERKSTEAKFEAPKDTDK